ncbi:hypothetical protein DL769_000272 [Monosporascus sp. CRB-8-3]|nr:hypothetical protein DL769_000272 [Monosporascus sp. CRB-8-3]
MYGGSPPWFGRGLAEACLSRPNRTVIATVRDPTSSTANSLNVPPAAEGSSVILVNIASTVDTNAEAAVKAVQAQGVDYLDIVIADAGISNVSACVEDVDPKDLH